MIGLSLTVGFAEPHARHLGEFGPIRNANCGSPGMVAQVGWEMVGEGYECEIPLRF